MKTHFALSALLAVLVAAGVSACSFITPVTTLDTRDLTNGTDATIGAVDVRNAVLITDDGTQASLLINLLNTSSHALTVRVQYETADHTKINTQVFLNPGKTKSFGAAGAPQFVLNRIDATPGGLFPVFIQYDDETGQQLMVPVLTNAFAFYSSLLPTPSPTPSTSPSPAPSPGIGPTPTPTPGG